MQSAHSWKRKQVTSSSKPSLLDDYFTRDELAAELGRCRRTLARWAWLRTGPRITRLQGRVLYHRDDVTAWLRSQAEGDTV